MFATFIIVYLQLLKLVGEETGPVSGNPPAVSKETKAALADAAKSSPTGSHVPGQDAGSRVGTTVPAEGEKKAKSEKERTDTSLFCVDVTLCSNQEYKADSFFIQLRKNERRPRSKLSSIKRMPRKQQQLLRQPARVKRRRPWLKRRPKMRLCHPT